MFRILLLLTALVTLPGTAAAASGLPHAAGTKDTKPADPAWSALRTVFDCSGRDTLALAPGLVDTLRGDTSGGPALLDAYACRPWNESGPEHVYRLEVGVDLELWAGLREVDPEIDLDLFLLDGCDTDACLIGENIELGARLGPGTYYLIVDGFGGAAGAYALALETRVLGVPPQACDAAALDPLVCGVGSILARSGNLFGRENLLQTYDCGEYLERGGEDWYALQLLPGQEFTVQTTAVADSLDAAFWLFAGCGPEAVCLGYADKGVAGEAERLNWKNDVAETVTVYLGVDCARAPVTATAGTYEISIACGTEVPAERRSFGGLRARYR